MNKGGKEREKKLGNAYASKQEKILGVIPTLHIQIKSYVYGYVYIIISYTY